MKYLLFFILIFPLFSCSQTRVTEGVMENLQFLINLKAEGASDTVYNRPMKVWFKDSCVIYEAKMILSKYFNDTHTETLYPVYKYIYFDLRTMRCQDYYSFSDTASVECNYQLFNDEIAEWRFWKIDIEKDEKFIVLNDTLIGGNKVKMIESKSKLIANQSNLKWIYYLSCDIPDHIFHIRGGGIDKHFAGCKVYRFDEVDVLNGSRECVEMKLISTQLSEKEKSVFKQWSENAKKTKVPIIPYTESFQRCGSAQSPLYPKDF